MNSSPLSLRTMLNALEQRLDQLSFPELRQRLITHALNLPVEERGGFLNIFQLSITSTRSDLPLAQSPSVFHDLTWPVETDPLLTEIEDFAQRVESGDFYQGFGWDEEIYDERSFGDESWVYEMDGYFTSAHQAFAAGSLGLARAAYDKLFDALTLDDEVGTFCGQEPAVVMLDANLSEAMSQYLRAVYETSALSERASELITQWRRLPLHGEEPNLQQIRDCAPEDVPDLDSFLPSWIAELSAADRGTKLIRTLLVEAAKLSTGLDGLRDLARQTGPGQGSLYLDWVRELRAASESSRAVEAAREALEVPGIGSFNRAAIAEELAELSISDLQAVLEARRIAWRSRGDENRLLLLHHAAAQLGDPTNIMSEELEFAESEQRTETLNGSLFSALLILSGEPERAAKLLSLPPDQRDHKVSGSLLIPYLLVSASKALTGSPQACKWAADYLQKIDLSTSIFGLHGTSKKTEFPTLSELFAHKIRTENPIPSALEFRLDAALGQLDRDVAAIVADKRRSEYQKAAEWLADGTRAMSLARGDDAGASWFQSWFARYPRHTAFRRELENARPTPLPAG